VFVFNWLPSVLWTMPLQRSYHITLDNGLVYQTREQRTIERIHDYCEICFNLINQCVVDYFHCWKKLNVFEVFEVYSHTCFNEVVNCTYDIAIWWVIWWKAEGVECAPIDDPVKHPSYTDNIAASYTDDVITVAVFSRYNITAANTASHYIYLFIYKMYYNDVIAAAAIQPHGVCFTSRSTPYWCNKDTSKWFYAARNIWWGLVLHLIEIN